MKDEKTETGNVVVVGAGNIGSHLLSLVARMREVEFLTIIDRDVYEAKNHAGQDIAPRDFGKSKAQAQAARLREANPGLRTRAIAESVENVPAGKLRADVILVCLDSRESRRAVNEIAWRLGVPFVDAGVEPDGMLARVNVYRPGRGKPCLECAWDQRDYESLEQTYGCDGERKEPAPTNAPASLGALAASLQAIECQKILAGDWDRVAVSRQVMIDAATHRHFVTSFRRNPQCRFDHRTLTVEPMVCAETLKSVFKHVHARLGEEAVTLTVVGKRLVSQLACPGCLIFSDVFCLEGRLRSLCRKCGKPMQPVGMSMLDRISAEDIAPALMAAPLGRFGFHHGDILTLSNIETELHFEIGKAF